MRGSEVVVRMLQQAGVDVVFGLCGDTSLPFYESLHDLDHGIRHVLTRDERSASYMADAYSRLSGKVGICEGPSGGGATYIIPGVAEANNSSVPLVCFTSDIDSRDVGRGTLTELDQKALFAPITRWTGVPAHAKELPHAIRNAFTHATTGSMGAAHVGLAYNVLMSDIPDKAVFIDPKLNKYPATRRAPDPDDVRRSAELLLNARQPLLVAGAGVLRARAWEELALLSRLLGAPVATSISGKGSIAETEPYALGVIGSNGGLAYRHDFVREADVIFYVGCRMGSVTTQKWTLPADGQKTLIQLDADGEGIGLNYRVALGIVSDAKLGLAAIGDEVDKRISGRTSAKIDPEEIVRRRDRFMSSVEEFASDATPIRPERFMAELLPVLPPDAVICADPGTPCPYFSAYWRIPKAGRWFATPRAHGALGYALPAVVGAHFARPEAGRVIGVMGDGSFGMSVGDLETIARLKLPVTLIVLNNSSFGWIKAGQKMMGGKYYSVDFSDTDHAAVARAYGIQADRVENPGELQSAARKALSAPGPSLLEVVVQPLEQARAPVSAWIA
jgi:acetolactate synthase-1/2/3 large subunit